MMVALTIRPRHQLIFGVGEIWIQVPCSTTRNFISWANWNPQYTCYLVVTMTKQTFWHPAILFQNNVRYKVLVTWCIGELIGWGCCMVRDTWLQNGYVWRGHKICVSAYILIETLEVGHLPYSVMTNLSIGFGLVQELESRIWGLKIKQVGWAFLLKK